MTTLDDLMKPPRIEVGDGPGELLVDGRRISPPIPAAYVEGETVEPIASGDAFMDPDVDYRDLVGFEGDDS